MVVSHAAAMADAVITAGAVTAMGGAGAGAAVGALDGAWGGILFGIGRRIGTARGGWMAILRPAILIRIPTRRVRWLRHWVRFVPESSRDRRRRSLDSRGRLSPHDPD